MVFLAYFMLFNSEYIKFDSKYSYEKSYCPHCGRQLNYRDNKI